MEAGKLRDPLIPQVVTGTITAVTVTTCYLTRGPFLG
jgi:hypothetical protein